MAYLLFKERLMMMKKMRIWLVLLLGTLCLLKGVPVFADETEDSSSDAPAVGFTYEVVKPDNQKSDASYFDLKMKTGQKQTVTIKLKNFGTEVLPMSVKLNGAKTNSNGVIEYQPNTIENDPSLKFDFVDIVKAPETIEIPASGEIDLNLDITMPETSFDGIIAGGIQLQSMREQDAQQSGMIINKYAYVIGMVLSETDKEVKPDITFNSVGPGQSNHRNSILINYSNTEANFLNHMTTEVQVTAKGSDEVLYDRKQSDMRMAPNSQMTFAVSMEGDAMVPGDYNAKVLITSGDQKWEWEQEFTITDEDADKYNSEDLGLIQDRKVDWKFIAMIVGGVILVIGIIFLVIHFVNKNKKKKQAERRRKAQARKKAKKRDE